MLARVIATSLAIAAVGLFSAPRSVDAQNPGFVRVYSASTPGIYPPAPLQRPGPKIPDAARQARFHGSFTLDITIGADGHVSDVLVKQAPAESYGMEAALIDAISTWTYDPARLDRKPVPIRYELNMEYQL
jgi:TonB family protein